MKRNIQLIHKWEVVDNSTHPRMAVGEVITSKHSYTSVESALESVSEMKAITWYKDISFKIINKETKEVLWKQ